MHNSSFHNVFLFQHTNCITRRWRCVVVYTAPSLNFLPCALQYVYVFLLDYAGSSSNSASIPPARTTHRRKLINNIESLYLFCIFVVATINDSYDAHHVQLICKSSRKSYCSYGTILHYQWCSTCRSTWCSTWCPTCSSTFQCDSHTMPAIYLPMACSYACLHFSHVH